MKKQILTAILAGCLLFLGYVGLSLVANIAQLAMFVDNAIPGAGKFVFWGLVLVFSALVLAPLVLYYRLPKPLVPPANPTDAEREAYCTAFKLQLKTNPLLTGNPLASDEDLERASETLAHAAEQVVKDTASAVFVSTAVMQNGRLDGLIVLATQMRMLWRIAQVYYVRPSPRQMVYLYSNVGANVLIADNLAEIDLAEITTPVIVSILPSLKGGIPGLQGVSTLLVNSMANGAANAFLTLRIGLLAKAYSESLTRPEAAVVKHSATRAALVLVAQIVKAQGALVVTKSWETLKTVVVEATESTMTEVKNAVSSATDRSVEGAKSVSTRIKGAWQSLVNR